MSWNWQLTLESSLVMKGQATLNIDGQQWQVHQDDRGKIQFMNDFGRKETFDSFGQLTNAIYSWYEDPRIRVVSQE